MTIPATEHRPAVTPGSAGPAGEAGSPASQQICTNW